MKTVLITDDKLYRLLVQNFPYYDDNGRIIGSYFSEMEFDNYHLSDKNYINLFINPYGIKDIDTILIQKSFYDDVTALNIALYFKQFRPETRVIFLLDEDEEPRYFCHRIATNHLAFLCRIAYGSDSIFDELNSLYDCQFDIDQTSDYGLSDSLKKKQLKKLEREYFENSRH